MRVLLATLSLASALLLLCSVSAADAAKKRSHHRAIKKPDRIFVITKKELRGLQNDLAELRRELAFFRTKIRGGEDVSSVSVVPKDDRKIVVPDTPSPIPDVRLLSEIVRVYPATATQRGQFNDRRRTHRHAGIDLGGVRGSPIVSIYSGVALKPPGSDRGYGPRVVVIHHDDGLACRYAHLDRLFIKPGQRVATGEQIGTMGAVGRRGFSHLHFECMPFAEYRRRPYGVHSLDPNELFGGRRGSVMTAGVAMPLSDVSASRVADRVRARRAGR